LTLLCPVYLREDTKSMPSIRLLSCYQVRVPLFYTKNFAFYALCFGVIPLCITVCFSNKEAKVLWTFVKSWLRATEGAKEENFRYLAIDVFNSVCVPHTKHCLASRTAGRRDHGSAQWLNLLKYLICFPGFLYLKSRIIYYCKFHSKQSQFVFFAACFQRTYDMRLNSVSLTPPPPNTEQQNYML